MALKIELSASLRDSEVVLRTLQELNREFQHLQESASAIGQQGTKGFEDLGKSITSFEQLAKSTKSVQEFATSLKQITASNSDLMAFSRSFSDFGRSVNAALGDASGVLLNRMKENLRSLKAETDRHVQDTRAASDLMKEAHTEEERDYLKLERAKSGILASEGQQRWWSAKKQQVLETPFGLTDMGQSLGLDPGTFMGSLSLSRVLSMAKPVGIGLAAAGAAYYGAQGLAQAETQMMFFPQRIENQRFQLARQAGLEALQNDPTLAFMAASGRGREADFNRGDRTIGERVLSELRDYPHLIASLFMGPMGGTLEKLTERITGAGVFRQAEEQRQVRERRQLDVETYRPIIAPGAERMMRLFTGEEDFYRTVAARSGDEGVFDLISAMGRGGISERFGAQERAAIARYGISPEMLPGPLLSISDNERDFANMSRRLGVSDAFADQMARMRVRNNLTAGQVVQNMDELIGGTGLSNIQARRAVSDVAAGMLQQQGGRMETGSIGNAIGQAVQVATAGGTPQIEAAAMGGAAAQNMMSQVGNVGTLAGARMDLAFIRLGIKDPMARSAIRAMMRNGQTQQAMDTALDFARQANPAIDLKKVQQEMTGATEATVGAYEGMTTPGTSKTLAAHGFNVQDYMLMGSKAAMSGGGRSMAIAALRGGTEEQYGPQMPPPKTFAQTQADQIEAARGMQEAGEMDAYRTVSNNLGMKLADAIIRAIQDATSELSGKTSQFLKQGPAPVAGAPGAGKASYGGSR